jgi:multimeric flavodoxin WrbA
MKLLVCNGSPRGVASNTTLLLGHFLAGFWASSGNSHELFQLNADSGRRDALAAFGSADAVLIAFPLYTDAMPGIVKEFMEELALYKGKGGNPALMFMVQSGFPEGSHTRHLVPYLEKFGNDQKGGCRRNPESAGVCEP